ncbi:MAG TPA: hypothetical protein VFV38_02420 [Ktedonobacteraceae bacterium]|nr:hypothetical protein [Ktedonobacteraceae bacterium]
MMKLFLRGAMLVGVVAVLLSALSFQTREAHAVAPSGVQSVQNRLISASWGKWSVVPSPNGNGNSGLSAVAVVSANAIWAVGNMSDPLTHTQTTLIEFWDGTQWQIASSPNPSLIHNTLYGVSAVSANDIWTVGFDANAVGLAQTLIEHWNGSSWSVVTSPNPGSGGNELFSVAAVSARDVWAVGFSATSTGEQTTLIEHWNGAQWRVVPSPSSNAVEVLSGVAAVSASDVWAVGTSNIGTQTLIEHWNGKNWQVVPGSDSGGELRGVAAFSGSDVWAVGDSPNGGNGSSQPLVEHWNGARWQVVHSPQVGTSSILSAVAAVSASDVWAVGSDGDGNTFFQTLIEHWNGSGWSVVPSASPGSFSTQLLGVAAVSATDVWAVGYADNNTLVERDRR